MVTQEVFQQIKWALTQELKIAVIYCRVSTLKQAEYGDSWEDQEIVCRLAAKRQGYFILRVFYEPYTGKSTNRPIWNELLSFCKLIPEIHAVFVRDLDRFNRDGVVSHKTLKKQLAQYDVNLKDVPGIVQGTINSLEHLEIEFEWSCYSPSEMAENVKSQMDTDEVRKLLTRLIGEEISLTRKGYWTRPAPHGWLNSTTEDFEGKERPILIPDPKSSHWQIKMYELCGNGIYNDSQIVEKINQLGFLTPIRKKHNRLTGKTIGYTGGKPLDVKALPQRISRLIDAGFIMGRWTNYKLVKAQFPGIVSIDVWNKAQRGKQKIVKIGNQYELIKGNVPEGKRSYSKSNPLFPYKRLVHCSICKGALYGSASTGRSGKRFPTYHCSRNHKRFAVNTNEMQETMDTFFKTLHITPQYLKLFEQILLNAWQKDQEESAKSAELLSKSIKELESEKKLLMSKIKQVQSSVVITELEKEIEEVELKIAESSESRVECNTKESDIQSLIDYTKYFLEHLNDFFLESQKVETLAPLFRLIFREPPTYEKIKFGTPQLRHYLAVSQELKKGKSCLVYPKGLVWNSFVDDLQAIKNFVKFKTDSGLNTNTKMVSR